MADLTEAELSRRKRINSKIITVTLVLLLIMLGIGLFSQKEKKTANSPAPVAHAQAAEQTLPGTPLAWKEIKRNKIIRATTKRDRADVTIIPAQDQAAATQKDLVSTVMQAAVKIQGETGLPVVTVNMICRRAANAYGELQLALASYIPDGKGYDGKQAKGPWDNLMAAERGFTAQELEYLRLWAELRGQFQKGGSTDEEALDNAISEKMRIKPGSLSPMLNFMQAVQ